MSDRPATPSAPSTDADSVVNAVLAASRLLMGVSARSLAAVEDSLTLPQFRMLVVLDTRGTMNLSRLAGQLDVNPSTALRMVDRLAAIGMVERSPHPENRREILIRLTGGGQRVVDDVTDRRRAEIARIVAAVPPEDRADLVRALRSFATAGGEPVFGGAEGSAW